MVKLNPFKRNKETDDWTRQTSFQERMQDKEINISTTPEEQALMEENKHSSDLTRWQQNLKPFIQEMVHELKREYQNENGDWIRREGTKPMCSQDLIEKLVAKMNSIANQNTILTKYKDHNIAKCMRALENSYILDLALPERKKYDTPLDNLSNIKQIVRFYAQPTLFRAYGGFESINQRSVRSIKELHSETPLNQQQKKSFLSFSSG